MRILIADDHIAVRSTLGYVLKEKLDDTVLGEATNLSELFAASFNQQPDLVLLDWELSGLPSAAMMSLPSDNPKRQRSEKRRNVVVLSLHNLESHPSVIALSSHPEARLAALTGGADAFILKGGPPQELFGILRSFSRSSK